MKKKVLGLGLLVLFVVSVFGAQLLQTDQKFGGATHFVSPSKYEVTLEALDNGILKIDFVNKPSGTFTNFSNPLYISRTGLVTSVDAGGVGTGMSLNNLHVTEPGTNRYIILTNGALILPPFAQPSEETGANGQSGGIYFSPSGWPESFGIGGAAQYILNLAHRGGSVKGQMLLSHNSIALEEQTMGQVIIGNDGSAGGKIYIRPDDAFGVNLTADGQQGHSHVMMFAARTKYNSLASTAWSYPAIMGQNTGSSANSVPSDPQGDFGLSNPGQLIFYTASPYPQSDSSLSGGIIGGIMNTNGWEFPQITLTNVFQMKTNYVAANFAPVSGMVKIVTSNNVFYGVSTTKTNLLLDLR